MQEISKGIPEHLFQHKSKGEIGRIPFQELQYTNRLKGRVHVVTTFLLHFHHGFSRRTGKKGIRSYYQRSLVRGVFLC